MPQCLSEPLGKRTLTRWQSLQIDTAIASLKRCDWFCIKGCKRSKGCLVACDNAECMRWFHCQCVGLLVAKAKKEAPKKSESKGKCLEPAVGPARPPVYCSNLPDLIQTPAALT